MEQTNLNVQLRTEMGKGPARRLRVKGLIPAVLYRGSLSPIHISVDPRLLEKSLRTGVHTLLTLQVDGGAEPTGKVVIIKELQRDPVYDFYLHADFIEVDLTKPMEIDVAIEVKGTAPGLGMGGILQVMLRRIEVRCLPTDIPHHIEADVSGLNMGDVLHVKDLKFPGSLECLEDPEAPVVTVATPAIEEKPRAAEEEVAAEEGAEVAAPAEGAEKKGAEKKGAEKGDKAEKAEKPDKKSEKEKK